MATSNKKETNGTAVRPTNPIKMDKKITGYQYEISPNVTAIEIALTAEDISKANPKKDKKVIVALDKSGSMSKSFKDAKQSVLSLVVNLREKGQSNIDVIFYSSSATTLETKDMTTKQLEDAFAKINSGGGTNFAEVFGFLASISCNTDSGIGVVFLSDGQDTSDNTPDKKYVLLSLDLVNKSLIKGGLASEVHSLGFTPEHDAVLLGKIAKLGTAQGSFQYIKQASEIAEAIETTTSMIAGSKIAGSVETPKGDGVVHKLLLDSDLKGMVFVPTDELAGGNGKPFVYVGNAQYDLELQPLPANRVILVKLKNIQQKLQSMSEVVVTNPPRAVLESIRAEAEVYDELLNTTIKESFKLGRLDRKKAVNDCMELKEVVGNFMQLLKEAMAQTLTNDKIATFTSLSYKNITKRGLQKKLDKLAAKNVNLYEELEKKLDEAFSKLDIKDLRENVTQDQKESYTCAISMKDYIDALEDQDCMCLTLSVARNQAAIADPSQLEIKAVNQTFLTADTFMDTLKYSIESAENPEASHGGFRKDMIASLTKGLAREDITGCMPLFISPEHWSIARHKMKPIMGWMTTLDVMGYAYAQVKIVPFLVLNRVLQEAAGGSEFKKKQFDMVLLTCQQIYKDSNGLKDEVQQLVNNYLSDPAARTIDVVTNNYVFLGHLLCAIKNGDVTLDSKQIDQLFAFMLEEEVRRKMNSYSFQPPNLTDKYALYGINKDDYVGTPIANYDVAYMNFLKGSGTTVSTYALSIMAILGAKTGDTATEAKTATTTTTAETNAPSSSTPPKLEGPEFDGTIERNPKSKEFVEYVSNYVAKDINNLLHYKNLFVNGDVKYDYNKPVFEGVGFQTLLAMYLQNYEQRKNADRRDAIANKKYLNPFHKEESITIIKEQVMEFVRADRAAGVAEIANREAAKASGAIGELFAATTDLNEAAGVLKQGVGSIGNREAAFHYVLLAITRPNVPLIKEKLDMLQTGAYQGIPLLISKKSGGNTQKWITEASHSLSTKLFKIWKLNKPNIPIEYMLEKYPWITKNYFDIIYRIH